MTNFKVMQIDWDLITDFDDRTSENFNLYADFKESGDIVLAQTILNKGWFSECSGDIQANGLWDAYKKGNIGERTFEGASISIGDILIDDENNKWVLTKLDFELLPKATDVFSELKNLANEFLTLSTERNTLNDNEDYDGAFEVELSQREVGEEMAIVINKLVEVK